jgi:hypothetical protein
MCAWNHHGSQFDISKRIQTFLAGAFLVCLATASQHKTQNALLEALHQRNIKYVSTQIQNAKHFT